MTLTIAGKRVLLADGDIRPARLVVEQGRIVEIAPLDNRTPNYRFDRPGQLILPGIVDLHGDAFERQLMPRPGVLLPVEPAVIDTDRQLIANGVTTAFHGLTFSWEQGLRGLDTATGFLRCLSERDERLYADHRVHLRFETFNIDGIATALDWIRQGHIHLLCFNDHFSSTRDALERDPNKLVLLAARSGVPPADYLAQLDAVGSRGDEVAPGLAKLSETASAVGLPIAAHDEKTQADRTRNAALGCTISDFPLRREAALAAKSTDTPVIMGAPNVLRGGSHMTNGISAADMIAAGV